MPFTERRYLVDLHLPFVNLHIGEIPSRPINDLTDSGKQIDLGFFGRNGHHVAVVFPDRVLEGVFILGRLARPKELQGDEINRNPFTKHNLRWWDDKPSIQARMINHL